MKVGIMRSRINQSTKWLPTLLACLIVGGFASLATAQPTLDELLNITPTDPDPTEATDPGQDPDDAQDPTDPSGSDLELTDAVRDRLDGQNQGDLFKQAVREMDVAAVRLGQESDPGLDTQRTQQGVIDKLDQLIAAAKKQQSSGKGQPKPGQSGQESGNAQNQGQQPGQGQGQAQSPGQAQGQGENSGEFSPGAANQAAAEARALEELREEWGSLPPRLRGELMEGLQEHFSPMYRSLTEAYYRQIAQESE